MKSQILNLCLLALLPTQLLATVLFSDNFNDGNSAGWSFSGSAASAWSVSSGRLIHNSPNGYNGSRGYASIDGITTPDHFILEADISVISSNRSSDFGHVGFFWGLNNGDDINAAYLRTHRDHVTHWSITNGAHLGQNYVSLPNATNRKTYRLSVEVDYINRSMTTIIDSYSATFTGNQFDAINQNSGGQIGLITWNDHIAFDNVVLTATEAAPEPTIPLPSSLLLLGLGLLGIAKRCHKYHRG